MKTFETIREDSRLEDLASSHDSTIRSHRPDTQGENSSSGSQVQNPDVTIEKDAPLTGMVEAVDGGINDQQNFSEKEGIPAISWTGSTLSLSSLQHPEVQNHISTSVTSNMRLGTLNRSVSALSTQEFARRFSQDWVAGAYRRLWV